MYSDADVVPYPLRYKTHREKWVLLSYYAASRGNFLPLLAT